MKSVIEDIYYKKRGYRDLIKVSEEYSKVHTRYREIFDELEKGLNDNQKQILDNLFVATGGLESEMACTHFKEGFKLGMLVAFEVFAE